MKRNQSGFTLVEIAIVLVIIGLLLGGVLKGQSLIENSKVKNAINDFNSLTAAFNGYVDRYKRIPGDDGPLATLTARGGNWASVTTAGNADGVLAIATGATFTAGGEADALWQGLRAAGFITGNQTLTGTAALPVNAFNGVTGISVTTTAAGMMPVAGSGLIGTLICMSQVPGSAARAIDAQLDDGLSNAGSVRATTSAVGGGNTAPGAAAATYVDTAKYTVCRTM